MLTYVKLGYVHYTQQDTSRGQLAKHGASWEFEASLSGRMTLDLGNSPADDQMQEKTLWVFPGHHVHGWHSTSPCERVVFHFSNVPEELERMVPDRGYYRVDLTDDDCDRLRTLARCAIASHEHPSALQKLQDRVLAGELSLLALRETAHAPISQNELALQKTQIALEWYGAHMSEAPDQIAVARAVNISPSYLRRLFHLAHGTSPKRAFIHIRMQTVDELLTDPSLTLDDIAERVGFASASTLRRAIRDHFGVNARQLRNDRKFARYRYEGKIHNLR